MLSQVRVERKLSGFQKATMAMFALDALLCVATAYAGFPAIAIVAFLLMVVLFALFMNELMSR